jgi:hypothetical protein
MKKALYAVGALVGLLAISLVICVCPCTQIETDRFVEFDEGARTMLFVVKGFRACPLTVEGPFPSWLHSTQVRLRSEGAAIGNGKAKRFVFPHDFTTKYQEATDGAVTFDPDTRRASIKMAWNSSYSWQRVDGDFPVGPPGFRYEHR